MTADPFLSPTPDIGSSPDSRTSGTSQPIARSEWRWVIGCALVVLLLSSLPYLYGVILSTPQNQYGGLVIGTEDGNSYLANMQEGRSGHWLFYLAYTPEPHRSELFFSFYILLGKLAAITGLSNSLIYHLSRVITIPFGVLAFYYFAAHFTPKIQLRRTASLIFCFTGGLGWLWLLLGGSGQLGNMPVDLWVPDASFFLAALSYPHLPLAQGLLLVLAVNALNFAYSGRPRAGILAAACGLGVSLIHPYTLPVIGTILVLFTLIHLHTHLRQMLLNLGRLFLVALPSIPYLIYALVVFNRNPAFAAWKEQNLLYSPPLIQYLLGFGLTLIFAILGLWTTRQQKGGRILFLRVWAISVPFMLYIPVALQRRFLDGYQAPLAVLAAAGIVWLMGKVPDPRWRNTTTILLLTLMSLTNVLLLTGALVTISHRPTSLFHSASEVDSVNWLSAQDGQPIVLASYQTGNYLPARSAVRVFVGHGSLTAGSQQKIEAAARFFSPNTADDWRCALIAQFDIDFVLHGPSEKSLGKYNPGQTPCLETAYDNGPIQIYRTVLGEEQ